LLKRLLKICGAGKGVYWPKEKRAIFYYRIEIKTFFNGIKKAKETNRENEVNARLVVNNLTEDSFWGIFCLFDYKNLPVEKELIQVFIGNNSIKT